MSNVHVLAKRSHTLKICFEHVQNNNLASAYINVHQRMSAYEERARRMPSVSLCMRAYDQTLAYAVANCYSVTALELKYRDRILDRKNSYFVDIIFFNDLFSLYVYRHITSLSRWWYSFLILCFI